MYNFLSIYQAHSVQDAIEALVADPEAVIIAGGSDILIKVREGKLAHKPLVGIYGIETLEGVSLDAEGTINIGPLTSFTQLTNDPLIKAHLPMLGHAADQVGGPQVRNVGTIGGNICNGVTSADSASTLFTYNALLEITGPRITRIVPIENFYKGPGKVDLSHGELLTSIRITAPNYQGFNGHYIKYAMRDAMDIATLGCAVNIRLSDDKTTLDEVRLAFGVAGPVPMRCPQTERSVIGQPLTSSLLTAFGESALNEVNPRTSWRASKDFRLQLAKELSHRALKKAIILGGGVLHD